MYRKQTKNKLYLTNKKKFCKNIEVIERQQERIRTRKLQNKYLVLNIYVFYFVLTLNEKLEKYPKDIKIYT